MNESVNETPVRTLSYVLEVLYPIECPLSENSTRRKLKNNVAWWNKLIGPVPVEQIDRLQLITFRNACLAKGLAPPTVNGNLAAIINLIRVAGCTVNTYHLKLRENNTPKPTPTLDELNRVWRITGTAAWPTTNKINGNAVWCRLSPAMWWRCLFMLAFSTGLRRSDLFGLKWTDVEATRIPTVNHKTKKLQYLPIPEPLRPWLELLRRMGNERVLGRGDRMTQIDRELNAFATLIKAKELGLQSFRRAAARAYETAHPGCGRLILNHGKSVTESHYLDVFETLRGAAAKLVYPSEFLRPVKELLCEDLDSPLIPLPASKMPPPARIDAMPLSALRSSAPTAITKSPILTEVNSWDFL